MRHNLLQCVHQSPSRAEDSIATAGSNIVPGDTLIWLLASFERDEVVGVVEAAEVLVGATLRAPNGHFSAFVGSVHKRTG